MVIKDKIQDKILTIAFNLKSNKRYKELKDNVKLPNKLDKQFKNS